MDKKKLLSLICIAAVIVALALCSIFVRANPTHECHACDGTGIVDDAACEDCGGTGEVEAESNYSETFVALIPPVIAIVLALITKEVYSSLLVGIIVGGALVANYNPINATSAIVNDGLIAAVSDTAGIFIFLVFLGILVALINKAGGSRAFGRWAQNNIKTKAGAMIATFVLGVLIFIDDYFNCLTVGSVMRPVTDAHKISRVKLAYLIDATAAPICMIAPISSWAAAVAQYVEDGQGLKFFILAIPYNFYSLLTLVFIVMLAIFGYDYGKMADFEIKAQNGDVIGNTDVSKSEEAADDNPRGRVFDLIIPIVVLIVACVFALVHNGGFFDEGDYYHDLSGAFGNTDATVGLPVGAGVSLIVIVVYLLARRLITFKDAMKAVPKGFVAMVPAIIILTFATALKNMTGLLGAKYFVAGLLENASGLMSFLPAIIFLVALGLSFSTGTSWGTFGILIPIVATGIGLDSELGIIAMSACLAGSVCGDHCSPISDTTIMASAGAECNHVNHVETQLPYALTVAGLSFICYIIAGFLQSWYIVLPIGIALTVGAIFLLRMLKNKAK